MKRVQLRQIAYARSGDKGDICNIGLMALTADYFQIIRQQVTPEKVKQHYGDMIKGEVKVYELPNVNALNVVCSQALGGGATRTTRFDQTGKSMGAALLRMEVDLAD